MVNYAEYTMEDFYSACEKYYAVLTYNMRPVSNPIAYLLGGQSGAGKSILHEILKAEKSNIIIIDGDRFRERHPNYEIIAKIYGIEAANYTQSFANSIVNALIEKLSADGYNIIVEGTCRRADVPMKTCNDLKEKGYRVELAVMCTDAKTSWQNTINRYNTMKALGVIPRAVPLDKYNEMINALPNNIGTLYNAKIFDDIRLFDTTRHCLYQYSKTPNINPQTIVESKLYQYQQQEITDEDELDEVL